MKKLVLLFCISSLSVLCIAQDTLPNFSVVKNKEAFSIISWYNDYGIVKQITIQRSTDSLKRFASIATIPNAMTKKGVFLDKKSKFTNFYYRIYVQLPEGQFFYTKSARVGSKESKKDSLMQVLIDSTVVNIDTANNNKPKTFVPSDYIFTDKKGNIIITLPNAESKNYSITFYDEANNKVLQVPKVKESSLILEKYNFIRSGWYYFEIMEQGKLLERHKFQIVKEKP
jgi:hypothetical protein